MASLWGTITGADRKNASAEQLKREDARLAAERAQAAAAAREQAERDAARKKVGEIAFKRGGAVAKKTTPKPMAKRPAVKAKGRK